MLEDPLLREVSQIADHLAKMGAKGTSKEVLSVCDVVPQEVRGCLVVKTADLP